MAALWHAHRPHNTTLPFHGPVAGLRLTRLFGAASGIRALPGSAHDLTVARIRGMLDELSAAGLITLADKCRRSRNSHG